MKEIDFYPEICDKFQKYLKSYLPKNATIHFSYNKLLPQMISEINSKFGLDKNIMGYIPKLKLDILFGVRINQEKISFILFEVKYLNSLALSEYSQLSGYLQVAKNIKWGILFLVLKPDSSSPLSSDFNEIIRTRNLPMKWQMLAPDLEESNVFDFSTGICSYVPNNGIDWVNTDNIGGISGFKDLADMLITDA